MARKDNKNLNQEVVLRVPLPRGIQVLGVVIGKLGGGKYRVYCSDGNERLCRIPGAKRRYLWIHLDSIVVVKPWDAQGNERGDLVINYSKAQIGWLKKKGYLDKLKEFL